MNEFEWLNWNPQFKDLFFRNFAMLQQYMLHKVLLYTFLHSAETIRQQKTVSQEFDDFQQKYNISKNDFFFPKK